MIPSGSWTACHSHLRCDERRLRPSLPQPSNILGGRSFLLWCVTRPSYTVKSPPTAPFHFPFHLPPSSLGRLHTPPNLLFVFFFALCLKTRASPPPAGRTADGRKTRGDCKGPARLSRCGKQTDASASEPSQHSLSSTTLEGKTRRPRGTTAPATQHGACRTSRC